MGLALGFALACDPPGPLRDGCTADECGGMPAKCPGGSGHVARCERLLGKCVRSSTPCQ